MSIYANVTLIFSNWADHILSTKKYFSFSNTLKLSNEKYLSLWEINGVPEMHVLCSNSGAIHNNCQERLLYHHLINYYPYINIKHEESINYDPMILKLSNIHLITEKSLRVYTILSLKVMAESSEEYFVIIKNCGSAAPCPMLLRSSNRKWGLANNYLKI